MLMNKKRRLLYAFMALSLVVFFVYGMSACATLDDILSSPTPPEGYGWVFIENCDIRPDQINSPTKGDGRMIQSITVNGISNRAYSWSNTYKYFTGGRPNSTLPKGYIPGTTESIGEEMEWVAINRKGEEKQAKGRLLPYGDYEMQIVWATGERTITRLSVTKPSDTFEVRLLP